MGSAFEIDHRDGETAARTGTLETTHGKVQTPAFMPVGTKAAVKTLTPDELTSAGAEIILGNTYHLYLRPDVAVIEDFGGLHSFMGWTQPILTDSGGFQVFSLGHLRSLDEEGVTFQSHIDGSSHLFTPESVVTIQEALGSDIAMVLDECTPFDVTADEARRSFERTTRWAERARRQAARQDQLLFGIVQGGMYPNLRRQSARELVALDFAGYGIGGLSVGEPKATFYEMLAVSASELPENKPRYLMGAGAPEDLFEGVRDGIDMFDCVLQTRLGRTGSLFTRDGRINIRNARFTSDRQAIDKECDCYTCARFSLGYLHHLFRTKEMLGYRLATLHNVRWTIRLMETMRDQIRAGSFSAFRDDFLERYSTVDESTREDQRVLWVKSRKGR